jgi:hypothetical protein
MISENPEDGEHLSENAKSHVNSSVLIDGAELVDGVPSSQEWRSS